MGWERIERLVFKFVSVSESLGVPIRNVDFLASLQKLRFV